MKLSQRSIDRLLDRFPVARLATVGPDGAPHLVPIVFVKSDERIWSPVDGKPKSGSELARVENIRARPRVSLLLDEYAEDWSRLWWLRLDAEARVVRPADPETAPRVAGALDALRAKYPQYRAVPVLRDPPTLLELRVLSATSWTAGKHEVES